MKRLWIVMVVFMGINFNPVQAGDWQAVNTQLEHAAYGRSSKGGAQAAKTGPRVTRPTKETSLEAARTIDGSPQADIVNPVGVVADDGINLYSENTKIEDVGLPSTGKVFQTAAGQVLPANFYNLILGNNTSAHECLLRVRALALSNAAGNTIWLSSVSQTCDINQVGAGGRDQAGAFVEGDWINYYIIYDPIHNDVSSIASASSSAPTLPGSFQYYARVRSDRVEILGTLDTGRYQINQTHYHSTNYAKQDQGPANILTWETVDLSDSVAPTAIAVFGLFGNTTTAGASRLLAVGSDTFAHHHHTMQCDTTATTSPSFANVCSFQIPLVIAQQMAWEASVTSALFTIQIVGYIDNL